MDKFEFTMSEVFSDTEARTIRGIAVPLDATANKGGRTWRFLRDSLKFGDRTPLLQYHDTSRPVGKLVHSAWTDRGLEVHFKVSKTTSGDEALQLAHDGVLGFSVGIEDVVTAAMVGEEFQVSDALCGEVSLTPVPAFAGAAIENVKLSKDEAAMPENTPAVDAAALTAAMERMTNALETFSNRPEPQPVPVATVKEQALYRFDGHSGQHDFAADLKAAIQGDHTARERLDKFVVEKFAVGTNDVSALTPNGYRPDLYVGARPYTRTLTRIITQATVNDLTPFAYPRLTGMSGPWVSPHVAGVEPALAGGATWGIQTITPSALSGKVEVLREVVDMAGPQVSTMLWNKFLMESEKAAEARLVAALDGLTLPGEQVVAMDGTDAALADALDTTILDLTEPDRYAGLVAAAPLYRDLYTARDGDGRKLFPAVGQAVNADGTANGRRSLDLNGVLAFRSPNTANSYLIDPSTVFQFLSTPRRFDFDIQVKSVYIGFFQYAAEAITDTTGIIRITHA